MGLVSELLDHCPAGVVCFEGDYLPSPHNRRRRLGPKCLSQQKEYKRCVTTSVRFVYNHSRRHLRPSRPVLLPAICRQGATLSPLGRPSCRKPVPPYSGSIPSLSLTARLSLCLTADVSFGRLNRNAPEQE